MKKEGDYINSTERTFFCEEAVGKGWTSPIEKRFETLIEAKRDKPFDWYKELGIDKADASRIRRGLMIPPEWLRIKIAGYFGVDSSVIWKVEEIVKQEGAEE